MTVKRSLADLCIFDGKPAYRTGRWVGRPNIGSRSRLLERMNELLDRAWLTNNGPFVQEFERKIAQLSETRHCVATSNGTSALEIAARALNMSGEILVPSYTFIATAHALSWQGLRPVFCDIGADSYTIDAYDVERKITEQTGGIVGVHVWGKTCAIDLLESIASRYGLPLLFDASHALGCSRQSTKVGSFGDAEVLSFHATKILNSFEGGAVLTNNTALARRVSELRNFGFTDHDEFGSPGINAKMTEVCAATGLTNIESLDDFIKINRNNYHRYRQQLADIVGVNLIQFPENECSNYHYIVAQVDETQTKISRDELLQSLSMENVFAKDYFNPACHEYRPYRSSNGTDPSLVNTVRASAQTLVFPTGVDMSEEDIDIICSIVRVCVEGASRVRSRLAELGHVRRKPPIVTNAALANTQNEARVERTTTSVNPVDTTRVESAGD